MNTLLYCLYVLKIKEDFEVYRNAVKLSPIESENNWISAIKIIANASQSYTFSQSQLADFLTLAAKGIEHTNTSSDTIVFKIYRDIIENYDNFSESLKSNYPRIIVDVISTINHDSKVNPIIIEKYYQLKKQEAALAKKEEEEHLGKTLTTPSSSTTTAAAIHKEKLSLSNDELIERLAQITNRDRIALQKAVERLTYSDLKKISELCRV